EVISVGSINIERQASRFTSSNKEVDLVAPGQGKNGGGVISTYPGGKYAGMQGTSMATPHVSGALALIINSANTEFLRKLTEAEIYAQLIRKTVPLGYSKTLEGNGMLYLLTDEIMAKLIKNTPLLNQILN
ncbi:MAG: S8 family peptidase, partial [Clostridium sp.]